MGERVTIMSKANEVRIRKSMEGKIFEKACEATRDHDQQIVLVKLIKKKVVALLRNNPGAKDLWNDQQEKEAKKQAHQEQKNRKIKNVKKESTVRKESTSRKESTLRKKKTPERTAQERADREKQRAAEFSKFDELHRKSKRRRLEMGRGEDAREEPRDQAANKFPRKSPSCDVHNHPQQLERPPKKKEKERVLNRVSNVQRVNAEARKRADPVARLCTDENINNVQYHQDRSVMKVHRWLLSSHNRCHTR